MRSASLAFAAARPRAPAPSRASRPSSRVLARRASNASASTTSDVAPASSRPRQDGFYDWLGHRVHYECSGDPSTATRHVVLLHGFGVGTFHYEAQLASLSDARACVWALDLIGQGASWPPPGADAAPGVRYSVDTWRDQVEHFLLERVRAPAFLAGNSLGGYIATYVAATAPDLCAGLVLMNATPFWAFLPADPDAPGRRVAPWSGRLPVPRWIKTPIRAYWDSFRSDANVRGLLSLVYARPETIDDRLVSDIIRPTNDPAALSAFCSVVFSPKSATSFDEMLAAIDAQGEETGVPVALVYGRDDPWVVPLWGQRLKRAVPRATYYELENTGHCPAHESPDAVNDVMDAWISWIAGGREGPPPDGSRDGRAKMVDGSPRNVFERFSALTGARR